MSVVVAAALVYASVRAVLAHLRWQATQTTARLSDAAADEIRASVAKLRSSVEALELRALKIEGLRARP